MGNSAIVKNILLYIEENLEQDLTLEKIAEALHYSKYYMARTFKEHTSVTIYGYIRGRRLKEAARKLAGTKFPVVEIALEAGYNSQQAFNQAFRREYGYTPLEYRRTEGCIFRQDKDITCYSGKGTGGMDLSWKMGGIAA